MYTTIIPVLQIKKLNGIKRYKLPIIKKKKRTGEEKIGYERKGKRRKKLKDMKVATCLRFMPVYGRAKTGLQWSSPRIWILN